MKKVLLISSFLLLAVGFSWQQDVWAQDEEDAIENPPLIFVAYPQTVTPGKNVLLEWKSEGADYCIASGAWKGKKNATGIMRVKPKKKSTYALQCFSEDGALSEKISQTISIVKKLPKLSKNPPVVTLEIDKKNIDSGEIATLTWEAKGAIACYAKTKSDSDENWSGLRQVSGSEEVFPQESQVYFLQCVNNNGVMTKKNQYQVLLSVNTPSVKKEIYTSESKNEKSKEIKKEITQAPPKQEIKEEMKGKKQSIKENEESKKKEEQKQEIKKEAKEEVKQEAKQEPAQDFKKEEKKQISGVEPKQESKPEQKSEQKKEEQQTVIPQNQKKIALQPGEVLQEDVVVVVKESYGISRTTSKDIMREKISQFPNITSWTTGYVGPHTALLDWTTNVPTLSWVTYGRTRDADREEKKTGYGKNHKLVLKNLEPNTVYYYTIKAEDQNGIQGEQKGFRMKTPVSGGDYSDSGNLIGVETGGISVPIDLGKFTPQPSSLSQMRNSFYLPLAVQSVMVTAKSHEAKIEWKMKDPITVVSVASWGESRVTYSHEATVSMNYGQNAKYGFSDGTTDGAKNDNPETERTDTFLVIKGLNPNTPYHFKLNFYKDSTTSFITRDIVFTTSSNDEKPHITSVKDFSTPVVKEFMYPTKAADGVFQILTNTPSLVEIEYGKAQDWDWRYTDRQKSVISGEKHIFALDGLERNTYYKMKVSIKNIQEDTYSSTITLKMD